MTAISDSVPIVVHAATPYLTVQGAADAIEFYRQAFGAVERAERIVDPSGRIGHAEITLGALPIMISDEHPEVDVRGPRSLGGSTSALVLRVEDPDGLFQRAIAAGATVVRPLRDEPYGRTGKLADPFGHIWFISG